MNRRQTQACTERGDTHTEADTKGEEEGRQGETEGDGLCVCVCALQAGHAGRQEANVRPAVS